MSLISKIPLRKKSCRLSIHKESNNPVHIGLHFWGDMVVQNAPTGIYNTIGPKRFWTITFILIVSVKRALIYIIIVFKGTRLHAYFNQS